jgi:site-specific recombinase XerD
MRMDENQVPVVLDSVPRCEKEVRRVSMDYAIAQWLAQKEARTGSQRTGQVYQHVLSRFRAELQAQGLDLDCVQTVRDPAQLLGVKDALKRVACQFAASSAYPDQEVSEATKINRYAVISSFYRFCIGQEWLDYNPIEQIERPKVQAYASARVLDAREVSIRMQAIDRQTPAGKRDYALLSIYLCTGRRLAEVAHLRWQHVRLGQDGQVGSLEFPGKGKGSAVHACVVPPGVSNALLAWLYDYYGPSLDHLTNDAPLWVSLASGWNRVTKHPSYGEPLGMQAIADICLKHLGISKVHTTRHTWTVGMLEAEASVEEIQRGLGQKSLAATGKYIDSIAQIQNRRAEKVAELFGIE